MTQIFFLLPNAIIPLIETGIKTEKIESNETDDKVKVEPEEEDTIDTKVLYERFLDKVDKNQIQVIRKGDLRGQQNRDDWGGAVFGRPRKPLKAGR